MAEASEDAMGGADTLLLVGTNFPYTKQAKLSSKSPSSSDSGSGASTRWT